MSSHFGEFRVTENGLCFFAAHGEGELDENSRTTGRGIPFSAGGRMGIGGSDVRGPWRVGTRADASSFADSASGVPRHAGASERRGLFDLRRAVALRAPD
jgi:hypothetical protein